MYYIILKLYYSIINRRQFAKLGSPNRCVEFTNLLCPTLQTAWTCTKSSVRTFGQFWDNCRSCSGTAEAETWARCVPTKIL